MPTVGWMYIFQVAIWRVLVEMTLQVQSQTKHTCFSLTLTHSNGEQMLNISWSVISCPQRTLWDCLSCLFPDAHSRFNLIRFWNYCLNIISFLWFPVIMGFFIFVRRDCWRLCSMSTGHYRPGLGHATSKFSLTSAWYLCSQIGLK